MAGALPAGRAGGLADENGEMVQRFAMTMHNLGLARAGEELVTMLKSDRWRQWSQGGMTFEFLPGEFDYFLSQQDVKREQIVIIPDLEVKAKLEEAMDERRTGEDGYRRPILVARRSLPDLPGRPIRPFGYGKAEARALTENGEEASASGRPALGESVRRYRNSGGALTHRPADARPRWERLAAAARRLSDEDLELLLDRVKQDRRDRRKRP